MQKYFFSIILVIAFSRPACCQKFFNWWDPRDENIDSLKKMLPASRDTALVNCLNNLSYAYCGSKRDSSLYYVLEAYKEGQRINYLRGMAIASFYKAQLYTEATKAFQWGYEAKDLAKKANDGRTMGFSCSLLSWFYWAHGEYEKGLALASVADSIAEKTKDEMVMAAAYGIRANIYITQNRLYEALQLWNKIIPLSKKYLGDEGYANSLHGIARIYYQIGDHQTAVSYFQQSIKYREQHRQTADWGNFSEMCESYEALKKYDSALYYLNYGLAVADSLVKDSVAKSNVTIEYIIKKALIFYQLKHYDSAMKFLVKSLTVYNGQNNNYMISLINVKLGRIYFKQKQYSSAFNLAKKGMRSASQFNATDILSEGFLLLSDLYAYYHNSDSAYYYLSKYIKLKKPEPPTTVNNNLTFYKTMVENEKNESQIQLLAKDNELKQQRMNLLFGTVAGIMLFTAVSLYILLLKQQNEKQLRELAESELELQRLESSKTKAELEQRKAEMQMQSLQAKMNEMQKMQQIRTQIAEDLHDDIGSTLTSISYYSEMVKMQLKGNDSALIGILDKIGGNARSMVSAMSDIVWVITPQNDSTATLISRMKNYAAEMLGQRNIDYHFYTKGEIEKLELNMQQRKNVYLIYKEAIHNAVKYADCTEVNIELMQTYCQLFIAIQDNGKGFSTDANNTGNGLLNMKNRAAEIKSFLNIQSAAGQGTRIELCCKIT